MKKLIINIFIFNLIIATANSQLDRSKEPKPGVEYSMTLPKIERSTLTNGLKIVVVEHNELPVVQWQLVIRTGADGDLPGKSGTASLTADMIDEGTKTRTALQIADEIDFIGASISTSANYDASFGSLLSLKENLNRALEVYSDVIINPSFPENEFNRLKNELLSDLIAQKARPDIISTNIYYSKLFGKEHPYGNPVEGTDETVNNISIDDVKDFYNKYYVPNNTSLIVVGDVNLKEVVKLSEKYFGKWKKKDFKVPIISKPIRSSEPIIYLINKEDAPQSQIRLGNIGIERNSPDFYAVNILNQIIGATNGRLFLNLREAKGYTYGAYANFSMRKTPGPFIAYSGVQTEVTDSSLIEFLYEFNRIRDELVAEEEFEMYKTAVIQRLPRVFETPAQIANQIMALEIFNLPDDFFSTLIDKYKSVTREDIQIVSKNYLLPGNLTIVIVGDEKTIKDKIEKLDFGKVIICDDKGNEI